jgi:hypothetical protein
VGQLFHRSGQVFRNADVVIILAASKEDHAGKYAIRKWGKVYQDVLIDPIDLSHFTPNAIPNDCTCCAARCEPDLDRSVAPDLVTGCDSIEKPDASSGDGPDVTSVSIEERPDQAPTLEPVFTGECEPAIVRC